MATDSVWSACWGCTLNDWQQTRSTTTCIVYRFGWADQYGTRYCCGGQSVFEPTSATLAIIAMWAHIDMHLQGEKLKFEWLPSLMWEINIHGLSLAAFD